MPWMWGNICELGAEEFLRWKAEGGRGKKSRNLVKHATLIMPINHDIKQSSFAPFSTGHSQIGKYYFQENPIILEEMPNFTSLKYRKPSFARVLFPVQTFR
jgi:hypothetical protein